MALVVECSDGYIDNIQRKLCTQMLDDPDDYEKFQSTYMPKCKCEKSTSKQTPKAEAEKDNYYLFEVLVDKIKLIPETVEENEEDEFLDAGAKKSEEEAENEKAKLMARMKFYDFPTMEIEQEEYIEPVIVKAKKEFKEWTAGEEEEDEEKNWMNELKEKMKQIEKEEEDKEALAKNPPPVVVDEAKLQKMRMENQKIIGKSCFFSMVPQTLINIAKKEKIRVSIYQIGDFKAKTKSKNIGEAAISLCPVFTSAIKRASCAMIKTPVIATVKEEIDLFSHRENRITATISMYIRIVCMGYTAYPEKKIIPMPVKKKVSEVEALIAKLKGLSPDGLAQTCPLLKEFRQS